MGIFFWAIFKGNKTFKVQVKYGIRLPKHWAWHHTLFLKCIFSLTFVLCRSFMQINTRSFIILWVHSEFAGWSALINLITIQRGFRLSSVLELVVVQMMPASFPLRFDHSPCDPAITLHGPPTNAFACIICNRRFSTTQQYNDHVLSKARI